MLLATIDDRADERSRALAGAQGGAREGARERSHEARALVEARTAASALRARSTVAMEAGVWIALGVAFAATYVVSYTSLADVAGALGFGAWQRWVVPLCIDPPLFASVLAQLLAARWESARGVKALLLALSVATAPLTLAGNALRGAITDGHIDLSHLAGDRLVAFSVPGLCVVLVGIVGTTLLAERVALSKRAALASTRASAQGRRSRDTLSLARERSHKRSRASGERSQEVTLERALAAYRALGQPSGRALAEALGVSPARGRAWRARVQEALGEMHKEVP